MRVQVQDDAAVAREKAAQLGSTVVEAAKDGKQYIELHRKVLRT